LKSLASLCAAIGLFCAVPISSLVARGSARIEPTAEKLAPAPSRPASFAARATPTAADSLFAPTESGPYAGAPPVTRLQILDIARSAVGTPYVHGGESWSLQRPLRRGPDCSGLIAKAWQVPRAAESWEELYVRPTTETLKLSNKDWYPVPVSERRPGDVLVRYETVVRHAFIYERDDADFAQNEGVWVFEAAEPRVKHHRYRLTELGAYTLMRRRGIDDVGIVGRSRNWVFGGMIDAFRQAGGERFVGTPYDRGDGVLVHPWAASGDVGVAQDLHAGLLGEALLVDSQRRGTFLVTGGTIDAYRSRPAGKTASLKGSGR
jgi:hypothetical protein